MIPLGLARVSVTAGEEAFDRDQAASGPAFDVPLPE